MRTAATTPLVTELVLVPGAWLGGWVWKKVTTPLTEEFDVYPVTLTGMGERVHLASEQLGIGTAVQDVVNVIEYNDLKDVVLVGHSFAGKVVASAADRLQERVRMILYLDAFRPAKVRTPQGAFGDEFPVDGWKIPFREDILDAIGKDLQGQDRDWMLSKATPWPRRYSAEPVMLSEAFDSVRSSYIFCTGGGDPIEMVLKEKLYGPYRVIESGHWPMITKPFELVREIVELAT